MENTTQQNPCPRLPLSLEVECKKNYARSPIQGVLKNISLTGAFLQVQGIDFETQDKLSIVLNVSGRSRKLNAHVIWKNTSGVGIRFQFFNQRDAQIVDDLIYFIENSRQERRSVLQTIFKIAA